MNSGDFKLLELRKGLIDLSAIDYTWDLMRWPDRTLFNKETPSIPDPSSLDTLSPCRRFS